MVKFNISIKHKNKQFFILKLLMAAINWLLLSIMRQKTSLTGCTIAVLQANSVYLGIIRSRRDETFRRVDGDAVDAPLVALARVQGLHLVGLPVPLVQHQDLRKIHSCLYLTMTVVKSNPQVASPLFVFFCSA